MTAVKNFFEKKDDNEMQETAPKIEFK